MTSNSGTFDPSQHPRGGDPTNRGRFSEKHNSEPEAGLAPAATPTVFTETQRRRRGHDFYPKDISSWPGLYSNENTPLAEVPFVAHYFVGGCDWYVSEVDHDTGEAFGYADLGLGSGEFGYMDLTEMEAMQVRRPFPLVIERDLDFTPGTRANQVIDKYKNAPAA